MSGYFQFPELEGLNPNQVRGRLVFERKVNEAAQLSRNNGDTDVAEALIKAAPQFALRVGVMQTDEVMAAGRCAEAYIKACGEFPRASEEVVLARTTAIYNGTVATNHTITSRIAADAEIKSRGVMKDGHAGEETEAEAQIRKQLEAEIDSTQTGTFAESVFVEDESGEIHQLDVPIEVLDMSDVLEDEDLSIEGLRKQGRVAADFDTTKNVLPDIIVRGDSEPEAILRGNEQGELEVACPYCKKAGNNVYPVGFERFGCFDCDKEFTARLNLGDMLGTDDSDDI